jgi:hypothetical protein
MLVAGALAICLIGVSPPRLVGDGREYLAQAIEFASFHGPAFRPGDIPHIEEALARFDPDLAKWDIRSSTVADVNRGRGFLHFWFYSMLAAPGVWLTNTVGIAPTVSFTALNLVLFGAALWVALPRIGPAGCILLFAGPIVWWIDKAHTEIFTFALLTIAFALMRDRPWWSMIAAGAASTQNPPIATLVPLLFLGTVLRDRSALRDRRMIAGIALAIALALLHPIYTYTHYGTWSLLLKQTRSGVPTIQMLSAVVFDPSLGLVGNFPLFLIVVVAGVLTLVRRGQHLLSDAVIIPAVAAAMFLWSFSRTTNVHHGGTPSLSRYALWLIPLAVPLLSALHRNGGSVWPRFLRSAAVISAVISIVAFRPSLPQNSREPTWLATFLWTRFPAWNNPLPEVFIETLLQVDEPRVPVATSGCEKILVAAGDADRGVWPSPCFPAPLPIECQTAGALCYANLKGRQYQFVPVRGATVDPAAVRADAVWPGNAVVHVRRLYEAWNWPGMHSGSLSVIDGADHVSVESLGSNERFILVLRNAGVGATVRLRPERPLRGLLVDALTGQTVRSLHSDRDPGALLVIDLPHDTSILLLAMQAELPPPSVGSFGQEIKQDGNHRIHQNELNSLVPVGPAVTGHDRGNQHGEE